MPASVQPTLVRRLSDSGMTREEFCKKRGQGERAPPSVRTLDGTTHRPPCSMADAELAGFVSEKAADEYCRNNFAPRTLKRSGESRSKPHTTMPHGFRESISPLSCPGSIGNNKLPEPLKNYWNYETRQEKLDREAAKA